MSSLFFVMIVRDDRMMMMMMMMTMMTLMMISDLFSQHLVNKPKVEYTANEGHFAKCLNLVHKFDDDDDESVASEDEDGLSQELMQ